MPSHHNLDGMRAFAVLLVFIDHAALLSGVYMFHGWSFGWLGVFGVYLFFVHTCLVLMWSLERRPQTLDFYVRRIFRVYPLAMATVLLVLVSHLPLYQQSTFRLRMLAANLFLVQNLFNYPLILGTLWSLPLEVQMYVLLPPLFLFARRERTFWALLLIWALTCALARASAGQLEPINDFYSVVPHFLPGAMAYIGFKRWKPRLPAASFCLFLLALLVYFEYRPSVHQGWRVCLILGLLLPTFQDFRNTFVISLSHTIAKYSYGIYLLHVPCLAVAFIYLPAQVVWVRLSIAAILTAAGSWLGYHLVEQPMIRLGSRAAVKLQRRFGTGTEPSYGLDLI